MACFSGHGVSEVNHFSVCLALPSCRRRNTFSVIWFTVCC